MRGIWRIIVSLGSTSLEPVTDERDAGHYEWEIAFAPYDVDMASVKAKFEPGGRLLITVARR